jgi:hypothetical protein
MDSINQRTQTIEERELVDGLAHWRGQRPVGWWRHCIRCPRRRLAAARPREKKEEVRVWSLDVAVVCSTGEGEARVA